ncbi:SIMPL domain-containing protein [Phyllobacterium sp. SL163]|uniref:SIMPL domain-containing protein n=2 Tax=Phyllobacterium TaxID=28100 RepID=UPI001AD35C6C|nr:SIMPL domain-containing protein [Phyllobacterium sp.]MBQ9351776.1 SIMPL domain-containing protein [Phyllobacterium sp.]
MTPKFLAVAFAATAMMAVPFAAMADETPRPRITVTGEGEATAAPDMAIVSLVVLQEKPTAREALTANNETMAKVLDAMKKAGIAERDLQTSGFNIDPRYVYPDNKQGQPPQAPKIVGYAVSNSLSVRVRDLKKVGEILDQSVTLGVNQGGNLTFTNDKPETIVEEARKKAVANAIAKAKTLTAAAGVEVGKVIEISEQTFQPRPYGGAPRAKMMAAEASDSVPVAAGENSYNVTVNVTFELKN